MRNRVAAASTTHLTSLLIQVTPRGRTALLNGAPLAGLRLHQSASPSKLIALLEAADERTTARVAEELLAIGGVLTVSIITHLAESVAALDREIDA
jgi:nitrate reductase NapAB chaperone NapD